MYLGVLKIQHLLVDYLSIKGKVVKAEVIQAQ